MDCLLGQEIEVIKACNPSMVGLKGLVIDENEVNESLVILVKGFPKRIEKCLFKVKDKYMTTFSRSTLKGFKVKLTIL